MKFDIITIFPRIFDSYLGESIIRRAREKKRIDVRVHDLRIFSKDKHRKVDDKPYGGGAGMVIQAEPVLRAVSALKLKTKVKIILLSAKGKQFTQKMAYDWAKKYDRLVLISGRYEGIDERVKKVLRAQEISLGPYVLTDGDAAAMVLVSAVSRLVPGVIKLESLEEESHLPAEAFAKAGGSTRLKGEARGGLEYPHYTRPDVIRYKGKSYRVPHVLISGDHKNIREWRKKHTSYH